MIPENTKSENIPYFSDQTLCLRKHRFEYVVLDFSVFEINANLNKQFAIKSSIHSEYRKMGNKKALNSYMF